MRCPYVSYSSGLCGPNLIIDDIKLVFRGGGLCNRENTGPTREHLVYTRDEYDQHDCRPSRSKRSTLTQKVAGLSCSQKTCNIQKLAKHQNIYNTQYTTQNLGLFRIRITPKSHHNQCLAQAVFSKYKNLSKSKSCPSHELCGKLLPPEIKSSPSTADTRADGQPRGRQGRVRGGRGYRWLLYTS